MHELEKNSADSKLDFVSEILEEISNEPDSPIFKQLNEEDAKVQDEQPGFIKKYTNKYIDEQNAKTEAEEDARNAKLGIRAHRQKENKGQLERYQDKMHQEEMDGLTTNTVVDAFETLDQNVQIQKSAEEELFGNLF